jgi:hypothetical protein
MRRDALAVGAKDPKTAKRSQVASVFGGYSLKKGEEYVDTFDEKAVNPFVCVCLGRRSAHRFVP